MLIASIVFVALATYWFGFKEGFFSGVVHLVCVVVAGALAFAFWEPLAHILLGITALREWAWGLSLLGLFTVLLLVFRIATNLLIPERQNYPHLVDIIGGGATGLAAGILTAGVGLIGIGFLPLGGEFGGGYVRMQQGKNGAGQPGAKNQVPFPAVLTEAFYGGLSRGSFAPWTNTDGLATAYPSLARQAWSLQRDTAEKGRIEVAAAPNDLRVGAPYVGPYRGAPADSYVVVPISVNKEGFHRGQTYVLSASQARLVGDGGTGDPAVAYPKAWVVRGSLYLFDGVTNYVTNIPGEQEIDVLLLFDQQDLASRNSSGQPTSAPQTPKSLMYKGLRIPLAGSTEDLASLTSSQGGSQVAYDSNANQIPGTYVRMDATLGVIINKNSLPADMQPQDGAITEADGIDIPAKQSGSVNTSLRVDRLYQLEGTKLVKLDVSRGKSPVNIWGDVRREVGEDAPLVLVDSTGMTYTPIGWLHRKASDGLINVKLDPRTGVPTVGNVPMLSSSGKDNLDLLFSIPVGRKIVAVKLGDVTLGTVDLEITN